MTTTDPVGVPLGGGWVAVGPIGSLHILRLLRAAERTGDDRNGGAVATPAMYRLLAMFEVAAEIALSSATGTAEFRNGPDLTGSHRSSSSEIAVGMADPIGTREAAQLLGRTDRHVRGLCTRGAFDSAVRRAGSWHIERSEAAAYALTNR